MMMMDIYVENQQWSFSDANLALQLMAENLMLAEP